MKLTVKKWGWPEVWAVLCWKLAPNGATLSKFDMRALPYDRVGVWDDNEPGIFRIQFLSLEAAQKLSEVLGKNANPDDRAQLEQLSGRYQKCAYVLLWKYLKAGITLTDQDRSSVPGHLELLTEGFADTVSFRWVPRREAARIAKLELDNEGKHIREKTDL